MIILRKNKFHSKPLLFIHFNKSNHKHQLDISLCWLNFSLTGRFIKLDEQSEIFIKNLMLILGYRYSYSIVSKEHKYKYLSKEHNIGYNTKELAIKAANIKAKNANLRQYTIESDYFK